MEVKEAIVQFLEDEMYSFQKQTDGTYKVELYANYDDGMSDKTAGEILNDADPMCAFYFKIDEWYQDYIWQCERELKDKVITYLEEHESEYDDDEVEDILRELVCYIPPYKHYLEQEFCVNIMMDTGDGNYDFTLNAHYPCWYGGKQGAALDNKASIVWLAKTQGYTKGQLRKALDNGDMANPKGFLESMRVEMANVASHMQTVVFLVKMPLEQLIELNELVKKQDRNGRNYDASKNPECGYIVVGKETMCGLFDPWQGCGGVLEVELEQDVKIPIKYIWSALPDGAGPGYGVGGVYGMCKSAWKDTVKLIHVPKCLSMA